MNKKINYTDAPNYIDEIFDNGSVIEDFLPAPSDLVRNNSILGKVSTTLGLNIQKQNLASVNIAGN